MNRPFTHLLSCPLSSLSLPFPMCLEFRIRTIRLRKRYLRSRPAFLTDFLIPDVDRKHASFDCHPNASINMTLSLVNTAPHVFWIGIEFGQTTGVQRPLPPAPFSDALCCESCGCKSGALASCTRCKPCVLVSIAQRRHIERGTSSKQCSM